MEEAQTLVSGWVWWKEADLPPQAVCPHPLTGQVLRGGVAEGVLTPSGWERGQEITHPWAGVWPAEEVKKRGPETALFLLQ